MDKQTKLSSHLLPRWHPSDTTTRLFSLNTNYISPLLPPCCSWNKVSTLTTSTRPCDPALTYLTSHHFLHKSPLYISKIINSFHFKGLHWLSSIWAAVHPEFYMPLSHYSGLNSNISSPDPPRLLNKVAFFSPLSIPLPSLIYSLYYVKVSSVIYIPTVFYLSPKVSIKTSCWPTYSSVPKRVPIIKQALGKYM